MSDDIQAAKEASAEVQEILNELEAEGKGEVPKPEDPQKPEAEKADAASNDAADAKPAEGEKKDADDDTKDKPVPPDRPEKYVPVNKHNEERHKRQEAEARAAKAEAEAAELRSKLESHAKNPTEGRMDDVRAATEKLAEKHNLDKEFVSEFADTIVEVASKKNTLPKDIAEQLERLKQAETKAEAARKEIEQEKQFDSEFSAVAKEFPDVADKKEELKRIAFSEGNANVALRRLVLEYVHDNPPAKPGRKTAESPTHENKGKGNEAVDFASMTEEQFANLSEEQYALWEQWVAKKGGR